MQSKTYVYINLFQYYSKDIKTKIGRYQIFICFNLSKIYCETLTLIYYNTPKFALCYYK